MKSQVPFSERESAWREPLELLKGKWPAFVFGAGVGAQLPVFRFSSVIRQEFEPSLIYLMENGYHTVQSAELEAILRGDKPPDPKAVMLCFDHAWASLWTIAAPLLERYNFTAVTYAIPGRIHDSKALRPVWGQPEHDPDVDRTENLFCSWKELKALSDGGRVEVQSNGWSHGKIFSHDKFECLVMPETRMHPLRWPMVSDPGEELKLLSRSRIFHPLLPLRSRLSDALRHDVDPLVVDAIRNDPDAAPYLFQKYFLQVETEEDRVSAIRFELTRSKELLEHHLGKEIHQLCFPWGVGGRLAAGMLSDLGYRTAFADRQASFLAVKAGQNPLKLGRLPCEYIRALPGKPRKLYFRIHQANAQSRFS
ncbi:polysaccharide deacetylase family protein [Kiritimatiellota bacterium B12222]|nr:polysaccharide deacetylase family protein [Kiritimatiellota bacterium B12222]